MNKSLHPGNCSFSWKQQFGLKVRLKYHSCHLYVWANFVKIDIYTLSKMDRSCFQTETKLKIYLTEIFYPLYRHLSLLDIYCSVFLSGGYIPTILLRCRTAEQPTTSSFEGNKMECKIWVKWSFIKYLCFFYWWVSILSQAMGLSLTHTH